MIIYCTWDGFGEVNVMKIWRVVVVLNMYAKFREK